MATDNLTIPRSGLARATVSTWERLGGLAGIGFAILFVAGTMLIASEPSSESDADVLAYYASESNRARTLAGLYVMAFAGVLFIAFHARLCAVLRRIEEESSPLASIASAAGTVFVTLLFAGSAALGLVAAAIDFGSVPQPGVEMSRVLPSLGWVLLLLFGMIAASALILATSLLVLRRNGLPRWLGFLGIGCGVLLLAGVIFLPIVALPVWAVATSIALLRNPTA